MRQPGEPASNQKIPCSIRPKIVSTRCCSSGVPFHSSNGLRPPKEGIGSFAHSLASVESPNTRVASKSRPATVDGDRMDENTDS